MSAWIKQDPWIDQISNRYVPFLVTIRRITIRWSRPGMRRDLPAKSYDVDSAFAADGACPGCSAQNR
jgi:hypothetical protein